MNDKKEIVSIKKLSHKYGKEWAIKDINFSIRENRVFGLLGSNGAGKSTTMNSLCGILSPTYGEITVDGFDLTNHPLEARKRVGFLPQKVPLYFELTVDEYLSYCAHFKLIRKGNIKDAIHRVKTYCGLMDFGKRLIKNLSGGYQQRVGIAQSIIHEPKLVVLDEPTNGLDPVQIHEVRNLVRDISKGSTVLLSTHILSEVKELCTDIVMIESGKLVFNGTLSEFNDQVKPNTLFILGHRLPNVESLKKIPGVIDAAITDVNKAKLKIDNLQEVPKELIERGASEGWGLEEVYREQVSLDHVFSKLSNKKLKNGSI